MPEWREYPLAGTGAPGQVALRVLPGVLSPQLRNYRDLLVPRRGYGSRMPLTRGLAAQLRRLSPREKAAIADHLWREAETKLGPTARRIALLDARAAKAVAHRQKLKPAGDALRRLRR